MLKGIRLYSSDVVLETKVLLSRTKKIVLVLVQGFDEKVFRLSRLYLLVSDVNISISLADIKPND